MVFGVPPDFFNSLKKHHGKLPKERKVVVSSLSQPSPSPEEKAEREERDDGHDDDEQEEEDDQDDQEDDDDDEHEAEEESEPELDSADESESDAPIVLQPPARGRSRAGRGARTSRARGARTTARSGRSKPSAARTVSPVRTRPSRNAAPALPLTEGDDDEPPSNQTTPEANAKLPLRFHSLEPAPSAGNSDGEDEKAGQHGDVDRDSLVMEGVQSHVGTPGGSPPEGLLDSILDGTYAPTPASKSVPKLSVTNASHLPVPKIALPTRSASHTPRDLPSTPAESAVPKLLDPEDDILSDSDLPEPWIEEAPSPVEADCEDQADYLLQKRYRPLADVQAAIAALTKFPASQRRTENLYALAENTQRILRAWQDEYLMLDARVSDNMKFI